MSARSSSTRFARFGTFEADLHERVLVRNGLKVKLQNQPFDVLATLLEHPGETVSGEELSRRIWPEGTFVEFEHSIATAVLKIRRALDDSAETPRFIETIPRRGYRFIAPVQLVSESRFATRPRPRVSPKLRWALTLIATTGLVVPAVWYLTSTREAAQSVPAPTPLTATPGWETTPSFSPDGRQVAYTWCEEGTWILRGNCDVFVKSVGSDTSRPLTRYPWIDMWPAWSPDGRLIAFLRLPPDGMAAYYSIPATSGRERQLAETFPPVPPVLFGAGISWFPDGRHIAVIVRDSPDGPRSLAALSLESGARRPLTNPPFQNVGDTAVAVSPDGSRIAFVRTGLAHMPSADIYILDLSSDLTAKGRPRRLVPDLPAPVSLAWMPEGDAIIFSSGGNLWRVGVDAGGSKVPERLPFGGGRATEPAVSPDGRRLAYSEGHLRQNIWRVELADGGEAAGSQRELISSTREDGWPQYSPGDRRIAFLSDRSGTRQIYICDADGKNLVRVTSLASGVERPYPGWSPDGDKLTFAARVSGNPDVFVVDVRGGAPRRLTTASSADYHPQFSRDGEWIYFASDRTGEPQIWRMPSAGGEAVQVTEQGGEGPFEYPDGRYLYYFKAGAAGTERVWMRPLSGGDEQQVLPEVFRGNFALLGDRVYFIPQRDVTCDCYHLQWLDLATGKSRLLMDIRNVGGGLSVSGSRRSLLYTTVLHTSGDLMLVENLR